MNETMTNYTKFLINEFLGAYQGLKEMDILYCMEFDIFQKMNYIRFFILILEIEIWKTNVNI